VTVLLVHPACEAKHPSSSAGRRSWGGRGSRSWMLTLTRLDPVTEKKEEALICVIIFFPHWLLRSRRGTTLHHLDPFRRVGPLQRHQISDLEGASGLRPLV
jgi:hypothetical protein